MSKLSFTIWTGFLLLVCHVATAHASQVTAIASGMTHCLALRSDGTVWAWGDNTQGQLGLGDSIARRHPEEVRGPGGVGILNRIVAIAAGNDHSLALRNDGTVLAWGQGLFGQLGNGTTDRAVYPTQVTGPGGTLFDNVAAIAAGGTHSVFLRRDGTVWCCGYNIWGELGDGTRDQKNTPTIVLSPDGCGTLYGICAVSAGFAHTLARREDGTAWGWGSSDMGQLGLGWTPNSVLPKQVHAADTVSYLTGLTQLRAGGLQSYALRIDGSVWAWGGNDYGQLGSGTWGTFEDGRYPSRVLGPDSVGFFSECAMIGSGNENTVAVRRDGSAWCWGRNNYGQAGIGTTGELHYPSQVVGPEGVGYLSEVTAIAGGSLHTMALRTDGTVWVWGWNYYGQLGNDAWASESYTPVQAQVPTTDVEEYAPSPDDWALGPNPTIGPIHWDKRLGALRVLDLEGREVRRLAATGQGDLSVLPAGLYMVAPIAGNMKPINVFLVLRRALTGH